MATFNPSHPQASWAECFPQPGDVDTVPNVLIPADWLLAVKTTANIAEDRTDDPYRDSSSNARDLSSGTWSNPGNAKTEDGTYATITVTPEATVAWSVPYGGSYDGGTHWLVLRDWGFALPSDAVIKAVYFAFKWKITSSDPDFYPSIYDLGILKGNVIQPLCIGNSLDPTVNPSQTAPHCAGSPTASRDFWPFDASGYLAAPGNLALNTDAYSSVYVEWSKEAYSIWHAAGGPETDGGYWFTDWTLADINDAGFGLALSFTNSYRAGSNAGVSLESARMAVYYTAAAPVDTSTQHLQADFLPPYPADVWRGTYEAQYCLEADYPEYVTPKGSPVPGDTFRVRYMATTGGNSYYARIRTIDLDGKLGDWTEGGPFLVGSDVPPGGPLGGGTVPEPGITKDDLLLMIGPVEYQGIAGNPAAFGNPANNDLTAANGSQSPGYIAPTADGAVATNFANGGFDMSGNLRAGFVSTESIKNLLYAGATTKVLFDVQDWFGISGHINVGYVSDNVTYQTKQIAEILARGGDGPWWTWSGYFSSGHAGRNAINSAELKGLAQCVAQGAKCALMLDRDGFSSDVTSNPTQMIKDHLDYANTNYFGSSAYLKISGRPVFGFFGENTVSGIDWSAISAHGATLSNGNPWWVFRNNQGFSNPISKATFGWPEPGDSTYLTDFYNAALAHGSYTTFGTAYKGFDDSLASWGKGRVIPQYSGQTWLNCFSKINSIYSSSFQLPFLVVATWDDYEEGTEVETGISGDLFISPVIVTTTLNWTVTGNEAAYVGYQVYKAPAATPNTTTLLGSVNVGDPRTYSLSGVTTGSYLISVYAVGKSCIQNVLKSIPFTVA